MQSEVERQSMCNFLPYLWFGLALMAFSPGTDTGPELYIDEPDGIPTTIERGHERGQY